MMYCFAIFLTQVTILESFLRLIPQEPVAGVNVLVFGVDDSNYAKRADSIVVIHLDPDRQRIGVLSIPRDTYVNVPAKGMTKVNHAYAFGGAKRLKQTISSFLQIPIDHTIKVNLGGVERIVDDLGGIPIVVEKDLKYEDKAGGLYIDIQKGKQTLSGQKALQYLRFRQDREGDIGRIRRQQTFMRAVASKISKSSQLLKLPLMIRRVSKNVKTDMSTPQMINLAVQLGDAFKSGTVHKGAVPGAVVMIDGVSYWKPDLKRTDDMVEKIVLGFIQKEETTTIKTADSSASKEERRQITLSEVTRVEEQTDYEAPNLEGLSLTVEVLNGIGVPGIARKTARYLKRNDVKVPRFGNAGSRDYDKTMLVDWKGNVTDVLILAQQLSIDPSQIIVYDRPTKPLDVTLVIGKDWPEKIKALEASNE